MGKVKVLDKHTAELIAAGEVVERPSSVVKELLENAIDAGAKAVTVEIQGGGVRYIRLTDDGCGISREDVPTAFLRHATSKIRTKNDLEHIGTLGFRGEALASICAVSRVELVTRAEGEECGTHYVIEGGDEKSCDECGCARGTTIIIRDIFYNTPARMKFLKKDVAEGNAVAALCDRIALSHPEVSIRLIREGKETLLTAGDGKLSSAIYAVFGREFTKGLIPVDYTLPGTGMTPAAHVRGYVTRPVSARPNRSMQVFFVNGRYCRSRTMQAALEEAFKGAMMVGKFPACVLGVDIDLSTVDVNVHPAKLEVRFTNERPIFDAVYYGVKAALRDGDTKREMQLGGKKPAAQYTDSPFGNGGLFAPPTAQPVQTGFSLESTAPASEKRGESALADDAPERRSPAVVADGGIAAGTSPAAHMPPPQMQTQRPNTHYAHTSQNDPAVAAWTEHITGFADRERAQTPRETAQETAQEWRYSRVDIPYEPTEPSGTEEKTEPAVTVTAAEKTETPSPAQERTPEPEAVVAEPSFMPVPEPVREPEPVQASNPEPARLAGRIAGEVFETYVILEQDDRLILIDKHAAHERLLYEKLVAGGAGSGREPQMLLEPVQITLDKQQCTALLDSREMLLEAGFEIDDFGGGTVLVRSVPMALGDADIAATVMEIAGNIGTKKNALITERLEQTYHTIACRAAVKAHDRSLDVELRALVERLAANPDVRYCPHGRPIFITLTRREIEKSFGRIV